MAEPPSLRPSAKARLATEILLAYAKVRWELRRRDLPRVVQRLRTAHGRSARRPLADPVSSGPRLGAAVIRTLQPIPADTRCLMRSLVLMRLLASRGASASLVIAVRPRQELRLDAHAWIELGGRPLLPPALDDHGRLVTL